MSDYEIPREGYIRARWEVIGDRIGYTLGTALFVCLFWACLRVPG